MPHGCNVGVSYAFSKYMEATGFLHTGDPSVYRFIS
jgi:hypothetical protein